jgi:hypothetical protein
MKSYSFLGSDAVQKPSHQMLVDYHADMARHLQTAGPAVSNPLAQAKVEGALTGTLVMLVALIVLVFGLPYFDLSYLYALLAIPLGVCVGLIWTRRAWRENISEWRALVWEQEQRMKQDIDGDGYVGQPKQPTFSVEIKSENGKRIQRTEFPAAPWQMRDLAQGILDDDPFTEGEWTGRGNLFSQSQFTEIRQTFIDLGLADWVNPEHHQQGVTFNDSGKQFLRGLAGYTGATASTLPSPADEERANTTTSLAQAAASTKNDGRGVSDG